MPKLGGASTKKSAAEEKPKLAEEEKVEDVEVRHARTPAAAASFTGSMSKRDKDKLALPPRMFAPQLTASTTTRKD